MKETVDPYGITFAPTAYTFNKAVVKIMNHFKWKRAALVYDYSGEGGLYVKFADILEQMADFKITGIGAISTEEEMSLVNVNQDVREKIKRLQDLDTKIFIGAFDSRGAALVFCELFKMNNFGPESVWILHPDAGSVNDWDFHAAVERRKNKTGTCTKEEYEKAAEGVFILDKHILYRTDDKTVTSSGLSLRQVFDMAGVGALSDTSKIRMTTAFDTMWAILLALKESSAALPHSLPLEHNVESFLGSSKITETIQSKLREVSFEGLTGLVSFTENEERGGILVIRQYQGRQADDHKLILYAGEWTGKNDQAKNYTSDQRRPTRTLCDFGV
ncbi:gamma-aminobutyric acid type B receptor subunit 2-like [Stylophora pistillata]|uniref:gamma-aminobutyric acid type B receptor subunit 2-like n=1 Tax=Stylophora pistillata TaxID=50429 RepID=UPI000C04CDDB|nr:gamma-aminobutyric acid type B receptor subunit 2-like [Stylophora pistillata]